VRDWGNVDGDRSVTWRRTVHRFRDYLEDKEGVMTVLGNESGEKVRTSRPHRFHADYSDRQYAKLKDLERGISSEYGKRLHTAMLTFTASSTDDDGLPLCPVDHLDGLLSSWSSVTRSLRRVLDGRRFERLAILEPHKSGYLHIHMAVFVDGVVTRRTLAPVIEAHLRNCDLAGEEAHDVTDDSTISIRHAGGERDLDDDSALDELAIYLAEYLGAYGEEALSQPDHVQAANAVLWATQRQRWRPSNGAQSYMTHEPEVDDDGEEWHLEGIERDGEFIPCEPGGGVATFETSTFDPPGEASSAPPAD
jgi:hypothetical protein